MKRMRRKRIRNTIFLLLLLIVLCTAGGFGVYMLKGGDFSTPANSFNAFSEFDNTLTSKEEQRAAGFAIISVLLQKMLLWILSVWMTANPVCF